MIPAAVIFHGAHTNVEIIRISVLVFPRTRHKNLFLARLARLPADPHSRFKRSKNIKPTILRKLDIDLGSQRINPGRKSLRCFAARD